MVKDKMNLNLCFSIFLNEVAALLSFRCTC